MKRDLWIASTMVVAVALLCPPADAQNIFRRVTGISVTQTGASGPGNLTAEFDVDVNTISPRGVWSPSTPTTYYGRPAPSYRGFMGDYYSVQTYGGFGTPARAIMTIVNPQINAIELGSTGSVPLARTAVPAVTPGTPGAYRGSFMHTYPAAGSYNLRVGTMFNVNFTNATPAAQPITTGNPVVVQAGNPLSWTSVFKFYGSTTTNTLAFTYTGNAAVNQTVGVTATAPMVVGGAPPPFAIDIPTATETGLIVLSLILAGAGVFFLRR